jgi:hypothetical protein
MTRTTPINLRLKLQPLHMGGIRLTLGMLLLLPLHNVLIAQATTSSEPPSGAPAIAGPTIDRAGCVLNGHIYICNFGAFHHVFHHAMTIAVEASPRDHAAQTQLGELAGALNRTVAPVNDADLIFSILPIDNGGVIIGPADVDLATLRIYARGAEGAHGELLWAETYRGQADHPWPATVHALIRQFQDRMAKRYR